MTTNPHSPPPEGNLIRAAREAAPKASIKQAARTAGISDTRWRQIEQGYRMHRGRPESEPPAPAPILARMAQAVGVTAAELESAGRGDAAAELAALPVLHPEPLTEAQMWRELNERVRRLEEQQLRSQEPKRLSNGDESNGATSRAV